MDGTACDSDTTPGQCTVNVALCVNRKDDQMCRPRTQYLDSGDLALCEQGKRAGFCAVATATRDGGGIVDATVARLPGTKVRNVTSQGIDMDTEFAPDQESTLTQAAFGNADSDLTIATFDRASASSS